MNMLDDTLWLVIQGLVNVGDGVINAINYILVFLGLPLPLVVLRIIWVLSTIVTIYYLNQKLPKVLAVVAILICICIFLGIF